MITSTNWWKLALNRSIVKPILLNFVNLFAKRFVSDWRYSNVLVISLLLPTSHYQGNNFETSTRVTDNIYYPLKQEERFNVVLVCVTPFKAMITVKYGHNWILHCIGFHVYSRILCSGINALIHYWKVTLGGSLTYL